MNGTIKKSRGLVVEKAEIRNMSVECEKVNGINLAQGVCDTGVPEVVQKGVIEAFDKGVNTYSRHDGLAEIRNALAIKLKRDNDIIADPETEIVVSAGSTGSFYCACLALLHPGDEVILFEPYYGYHLNTLNAVGTTASYVKMNPPDWSFTREDLKKAWNPNTRGIMVCTPSNPCGKIFTLEEIEMVADFAIEHDLIIFTDEIYEYIIYDGKKHISPGSLTKISDRVVTIGGYSKTYSITGWRIGYSVCRPDWAKLIGYLNDLVYVCAPTPLQYGVAKGINELTQEFYDGLKSDYTKKRDLFCSALEKAGLKPWVPDGAYYVLVDSSNVPGETSKLKAMNLLHRTGVASVPGESFYHDMSGENILRFCYAKPLDVLEDACERITNL
ncbi:MAG: aminotransferase [Candidatus Wallbacteria bacterium HGW-Wallbacteria-1]|jgi:aminotransferase|uniref:Aminotransferase n=1 Tax=Candidatus Wallbacteria bacterium HGW-Wallbacteria-1 TaxID=2013854 RepID=A0A2N1PP42_9BACT|nr:MAG: aminotransferase [Candidatus Wallbacteria bacterium HGW-Wallbacteria-1]